MKEPGESIIDLLQLINQDMNTGTKFQNRSVTITQNFIISPSKYSFNICRQSVAQLKVIQARELTQQNERTDHARVMNMTYYTILVTAQDASFRIFVHTGMFIIYVTRFSSKKNVWRSSVNHAFGLLRKCNFGPLYFSPNLAKITDSNNLKVDQNCSLTRNHKFRGEIAIISEIAILVHFQIFRICNFGPIRREI